MAVSFMLEYGELKRTTRFQEEQDTASPFGGGSGTRSIKYAYYFTLAGIKYDSLPGWERPLFDCL